GEVSAAGAIVERDRLLVIGIGLLRELRMARLGRRFPPLGRERQARAALLPGAGDRRLIGAEAAGEGGTDPADLEPQRVVSDADRVDSDPERTLIGAVHCRP